MKRAIRRSALARFKRLINQEVNVINSWFDQLNAWQIKHPKQCETRKQQAIRHAYRNDGRLVRSKQASGRECWCGCELCVSNWTYSSQREIARINDEEQDFISMNYPPDWGCDWEDITGDYYYDERYGYNPEDDWWFDFREENGLDSNDEKSSHMSFKIQEII